MASATIGNLNVRLGMNSAEFEAGAKRAQATLHGLGASIKSFAAGAVAALSIDMVARAAIDAVKAVAELGDVAQNIGITAEQMQNYNRMALASGASSDVMARGLQSIAEQSVDTKSKLSQLFDANGFNAQAMTTNDVIRTFATLLQNAKTPAEQLAIATSVLGDKVGRQLVEAMRTGAKGVDDSFKEMVKSGLYHTNEEVKRLQDLETRYNQVMANIATGWQKMIVTMVGITDSFIAAPNTQKILDARNAILMKGTRFGRTGAPSTSGIPATPGASGKGDLPSDLDSGFNLRKQTIIPVDLPKIKKEADKAAQALAKLKAEGQSVYESTRTPLEKYQLEIRHLNDLLQAGVIDQDTYNRAVKQLGDEFSTAADKADELNEIGQELASTFADWIGSAIDGTFELTSALSGLARQLSDRFLQQAFSGLFGGGASVAPSQAGGGLLGNLFGGFAGLFADGGSIPAGQWGIAGEAGPEIVRGPASVHAGGMGGITIVQHISANTSRETMALTEQAARRAIRDAQGQEARVTTERRLRSL